MSEVLESTTAKSTVQAVSPTVGVFYAQLGGLLKAGMPLPQALRTLATEAGSNAFRAAIERAAEAIANGKSPQDAFAAEERQLGGMLGRVAGAAAASGRLAQMLSELSAWTLAQDRIRRRIIDALSYPFTVLLLSSVITIIMSILVTNADLGTDVDQEFLVSEPKALLNTSPFRVLSLTACALVFAGTFSVPMLALLARFNEDVRRFRESLCVNLPIIGAIYRPLALSRLCGSIAVLMRAGTPYHEAVAAAGALSGFHPYAVAAQDAARILKSGGNQADAWNNLRLFPASLRFILASAEQRGDVPDAFGELAQLYQVEAEGRGRIVALLAPPVCLLLIGGLLSLFIFGMLSPLIRSLEMMMRLGI